MTGKEISFNNKSFTVDNSLCGVMREMERAIRYAGHPATYDNRTAELVMHSLGFLLHQWDWYCGGYWSQEVYTYTVTREPSSPRYSIRYYTRNLLRAIVLDLVRIVNLTPVDKHRFAKIVLRLCRDEEKLIGLDRRARDAFLAIAEQQEASGTPIALEYHEEEGEIGVPEKYWFSLES
jgi:hypothetical protein